MASESTALVRLEACTAVQIFAPGFIDPVIEQIEAEAMSEAAKLDISTETNRKALASLAYKVARSKTFIDEQRRALVADEKKRLKRIDEEGARIWDRLERLQKDVRKPLTDWEEADKDRIATHEKELSEIENAGPYSMQNWQSLSAECMRDRLREIETDPRDWEEFGARAAGVKAVAKSLILQAIEKRERYESEQAELARLRAEAAERDRKDREERIANEAAEKVRRQAEFERLKLDSEKKQAEARAEEVERRRIAEQKEASERAKRAAEQAERDKQAAIKAERERAAAKAQREKDEQERREASSRIRRRVLGEISEAIATLNVPAEQADVIASALAAGTIPHVTVVF